MYSVADYVDSDPYNLESRKGLHERLRNLPLLPYESRCKLVRELIAIVRTREQHVIRRCRAATVLVLSWGALKTDFSKELHQVFEEVVRDEFRAGRIRTVVEMGGSERIFLKTLLAYIIRRGTDETRAVIEDIRHLAIDDAFRHFIDKVESKSKGK